MRDMREEETGWARVKATKEVSTITYLVQDICRIRFVQPGDLRSRFQNGFDAERSSPVDQGEPAVSMDSNDLDSEPENHFDSHGYDKPSVPGPFVWHSWRRSTQSDRLTY